MGALIGAVLLSSGVATTARVGATAASVAASAVPKEAPQQTYRYLADTLFRTEGDGASSGQDQVVRQEVARMFAAGAVDGEEGSISDGDRSYLVQLVARNTGFSPEEAEARVSTATEQLEAAEREALEAAEAARKASIVAAFVLAASLLIGAAGASWAAGIGGRHRDEGTVVAFLGRRPS